MRLVQKIVLASTNSHKLSEFQALFAQLGGPEIVSAKGIIRNADKLGMVETHATYMENAVAKARLANQGSHYPTLADDSGLEVMALEGAPGVKSHRYASYEPGLTQDESNRRKLLAAIQGKTDRRARFVCSLALNIEGLMLQSTGVLEGLITETSRGQEGFGYDPVFIPTGYDRTLAEMSSTEKNSISHRALALNALFLQIANKGIILAKP